MRRHMLAPLLAILALIPAALPATATMDNNPGLKTLIVGTFGGINTEGEFAGEIGPILAAHPGYRTLQPTGGEFAPIYCWDTLSRCVTITGTTQANSGPGMFALARDSRLKLTSRTLFVPLGIAGGNKDMTLGDVGILDWVTNTGLGSSFVDRTDAPNTVDPRLAGWRPFQEYPGAARQLNTGLAAKAFQIAQKVKLTDEPEAKAERAFYPIKRASKVLAHCVVRGNDEFWVGAKRSAREDGVAQARINEHTTGFTVGCGTSAFEDPPIAEVLERFGWLDQTVWLRSVSDLEAQHPGEPDLAQYERVAVRFEFAGYVTANENHSRIAWALADQIQL